MNRILTTFEKILLSRWFIFFIFCMIERRLLIGAEFLSHDSGDSLGIFKFFLQQKSWLPSYWNWFENAGQPFWFELGSNRTVNFIFWPFLNTIYKITGNVILTENYFYLGRIIAIGYFFSALLDDFKIHPLARQFALASFLLMSPATLYFRELGMMDFCFVFFSISFFTIRYFITGNKIYLLLSGLAQIDSFLAYHFLTNYSLLLFIILFFWGFYPQLFKDLILSRIRKDWLTMSAIVIALMMAAVSIFMTTKEQDLLGVLRRVPYFTEITAQGLAKNDQKTSLFDESLTNSPEECATVPGRCAVVNLTDYRFFMQMKNADSYSLFIGILPLIFFLLGIIYLAKYRSREMFFSFSICLLLVIFGLGYHTPIYPFLQKVIYPLSFIRHTLIFNALLIFIILWIGAQGLTQYLKHNSRESSLLANWAFLRVALAGLYLFNFWWYVFHLKEVGFTNDRLHTMIVLLPLIYYLSRKPHRLVWVLFIFIAQDAYFFQETAAPSFRRETSLQTRDFAVAKYPDSLDFRSLNAQSFGYQHLDPRVNTGSFLGQPVVTESFSSPYLKDGVTKFGFMTVFMMKHSVAARLLFSGNPELFSSAFGVHPYGIARLYPVDQTQDQVSTVSEIFATMCRDHLALGNLNWQDVNQAPANPALAECKNERRPLGEILSSNLVTRIDGNNLRLEVQSTAPQYAYVSVPFSVIQEVRINGTLAQFNQANFFGIAVKLNEGTSKIEIIPRNTRWPKIYFLFYFANIILLSMLIFNISNHFKTRSSLA